MGEGQARLSPATPVLPVHNPPPADTCVRVQRNAHAPLEKYSILTMKINSSLRLQLLIVVGCLAMNIAYDRTESIRYKCGTYKISC